MLESEEGMKCCVAIAAKWKHLFLELSLLRLREYTQLTSLRNLLRLRIYKAP